MAPQIAVNRLYARSQRNPRGNAIILAVNLSATPEQQQSFATSYDLSAKITTACAIAVFVLVFLITKNALVGAFELCITILAYLYSPRSYTVSGPTILIKRLIGTVAVPLEGMRELRVGTAADFRRTFRLWGSGGVFGYYGRYKTAKLGNCRWYRTNRGSSVIVVTGQSTIVLSPSDIRGFLASVRRVVSVPDITDDLVLQAANITRVGASLGRWIGGAFALVVTCVVFFSLLYSPGPPRLTLTSNTLTVHDRFYPVTINAADIDVAGIRVVDIHTDQAWKPTFRTNGFANAHYHSGWFRVASGSARMYWADGPMLVLLPPRRNASAFLFEVNDPEQFVSQIRRQWAAN